MRVRAVSKPQDNPILCDRDGEWTPAGKAYMGGLASLTGVLRRRLYLGEWCAAEGIVWETYDNDRHRIDRPWNEERNEPEDLRKALGIKWYFGSQDWGFRDPGVLQFWGVAPDGSPYKHAAKEGRVIFRVAEAHHTGKNLDWWCDRMAELHAKYDLQALVCDPSRQDAIDIYNERVGSTHEKAELRFARGADNRRAGHTGKGDMGGIALVRQWFAENRIFFLKDSLIHPPDPDRKQKKKPYETTQEIPGYVYKTVEDGQRDMEHTDPACRDDGCDALRYAVCFAAEYDLSPPKYPERHKTGTLGDVLNWESVTFTE